MTVLRIGADLRLFLVGMVLSIGIFMVMVWWPGDRLGWLVGIPFLFLYFLWLGVRGRYYYVLGIIVSVTVILGYFLSFEPDDWSFSSFSGGFVALCAVWMVIHLLYNQKRYVVKELKDKARLDAVFENAMEGMLIVSQTGNIIRVNKYAEELFGYKRQELIGSKIEKLIPDRSSILNNSYQDTPKKEQHNRATSDGKELYALHKQGHDFPVEISLGYFEADGEVNIIAFMNDISDRKSASDLLKQEKERTQKLNKLLEQRVANRTSDLKVAMDKQVATNASLKQMETDLLNALKKERELGELKSRFVSTASHEFRTPLSTILSSVFLLEKYVGDQYEQSKQIHLQRIRRSVNNLTSTLNDFLSLSKLEEGKVAMNPINLDITTCINEIIDEMDTFKKSEQTILYTHSGISECFPFDEMILRNILTNLISNAVKFSCNDGRITVTSRITPNALFLQVIDLGLGIPESEQRYLFDRFFRANNVQHINGTGLGLNIVKKYIDLMDGVISYVSHQDIGTTFTVKIPRPDL